MGATILQAKTAKRCAKLEIYKKKKTSCVSLLLCLYHTVLVTALPPPFPSNVESACNDSGCEAFQGASNQHCIGDEGGMGEFDKFLQKCPKTFGEDCREAYS